MSWFRVECLGKFHRFHLTVKVKLYPTVYSCKYWFWQDIKWKYAHIILKSTKNSTCLYLTSLDPFIGEVMEVKWKISRPLSPASELFDLGAKWHPKVKLWSNSVVVSKTADFAENSPKCWVKVTHDESAYLICPFYTIFTCMWAFVSGKITF